MIYRGVGNLCGVDLDDLKLPVSNEQAMQILNDHGFQQREVDLMGLARESIGNRYSRGASIEAAPDTVDCSSLIKWLFSQKGIWLPRHSIDQRFYCEIIVPESDIQAGDLVFTTGFRNYWDDENDGVGHVGIATSNGTVIHAANSKVGVAESSLENFLKEPRGVRRVFNNSDSFVTIESPSHRTVEWSRQFRWIILQYC